MTIEQRLKRLEKCNKRLTAALYGSMNECNR